MDSLTDLIGCDVEIAGQIWNVKEQAPWSDQYYYLTRASTDADGNVIPARWDLILRPEHVIRQHITAVRRDGCSQSLSASTKEGTEPPPLEPAA